jgi:uncharacterized protein YjgD (DUF1641 family)
MAINIGDMLGGIGAAFGGTAQQYSQNIRQREQQMTQRKREELQARQQAMYQDAGAAFQLLQQGDLDGIISLANDRLELLQTFPDADPSDTMRILENAMAAKAGDPIAISNLAKELTSAASVGYASGILKKPEVESVVVNGNLVDKRTGDIIYQAPVADEGFESSPGITRYRNGVAVQYSRTGQRQVIDELGNIVTGEAAKGAIQRGVESGVTEQGNIAAATVRGREISARTQEAITAGLDATKQIPVLTNALNLLNTVDTGGTAGVGIRLRSFLGVESGDEGELSYLLKTNVLQQLRPIFGSAFTASEGERLQAISADTSRSLETNRRLLDEALRIVKRASERGLRRAQSAGDEDSILELEDSLSQLYQFEDSYLNTTPSDTGSPNPDLINRADEIVSRGAQ